MLVTPLSSKSNKQRARLDMVRLVVRVMYATSMQGANASALPHQYVLVLLVNALLEKSASA